MTEKRVGRPPKTRAVKFPYVPQEKQKIFHYTTTAKKYQADEVLYGGAAGGGKSAAIVGDAFKNAAKYPRLNILILRRTLPELRQSILLKQFEWYPKEVCKYRDKLNCWEFVNGSRIWLGYCEYENDIYRYQSAEFDIIYIDEAAHFHEHEFRYLKSRNRTSNQEALVMGFMPQMKLTSNPGGVGHCVPFGEVLTPNGWVDISDLKIGDPVYEVDENGRLVKSRVEQVHRHWFEGELWVAKARGLEIICTPEHRIAKYGGTKRNTNSLYSLVEAKNLPGQALIMRAVEFDGVEIKTFSPKKTNKRKINKQPETITGDQYVELMGWFLSEGYVGTRDKMFGISQEKEENREKIRKLLYECGFNYVENGPSFDVYSPDWWNYFKRFGKCEEKFVPRKILNASKRQLMIFFKAIMDGDGHWASDNSGQYYTKSKQLADDVAEVAVKLGYAVYISSRERENRTGVFYCINFKPKKTTEILTGQHCYDVKTETKKEKNVSKVPFKGMVYDIGVPKHHAFVIRQNGSVWVSGNSWLKKRFISIGDPMKIHVVQEDNEEGELVYDEHNEPIMMKRIFIPAFVDDNKYVDSGYKTRLYSLGKRERDQLLYGDWDAIEGQFFDQFKQSIHVIEPFEIPPHWKRYRALDEGYNDPFVCLWIAVDEKGTAYVYREFVKSKLLSHEQVQIVKEKSEPLRFEYNVADTSFWNKSKTSGETPAEVFAKNGVPLTRATKERVNGWKRVREWLAPYEETDPVTGETYTTAKLLIFDTCKNLIEAIPSMIVDKNNPEDIEDHPLDHTVDALRYWAMSRPMPTKPKKPEKTAIQKHKEKLVKRRQHFMKRLA